MLEGSSMGAETKQLRCAPADRQVSSGRTHLRQLPSAGTSLAGRLRRVRHDQHALNGADGRRQFACGWREHAEAGMGWGVQAGWLSEQACLAVDEDRHRDVRQKEQQNRRVHEPHGSDRLLYTSICSPMPITGWGCTN